jgi:hypothetical protein
MIGRRRSRETSVTNSLDTRHTLYATRLDAVAAKANYAKALATET